MGVSHALLTARRTLGYGTVDAGTRARLKSFVMTSDDVVPALILVALLGLFALAIHRAIQRRRRRRPGRERWDSGTSHFDSSNSTYGHSSDLGFGTNSNTFDPFAASGTNDDAPRSSFSGGGGDFGGGGASDSWGSSDSGSSDFGGSDFGGSDFGGGDFGSSDSGGGGDSSGGSSD